MDIILKGDHPRTIPAKVSFIGSEVLEEGIQM
jgi:hypothetical protein